EFNKELIVQKAYSIRFTALRDEKQVTLRDKEAIDVKTDDKNIMNTNLDETLMNRPPELANGNRIQPHKQMLSNIFPEMYPYYIVSDQAYSELPQANSTKLHVAWQEKENDQDTVI